MNKIVIDKKNKLKDILNDDNNLLNLCTIIFSNKSEFIDNIQILEEGMEENHKKEAKIFKSFIKELQQLNIKKTKDNDNHILINFKNIIESRVIDNFGYTGNLKSNDPILKKQNNK